MGVPPWAGRDKGNASGRFRRPDGSGAFVAVLQLRRGTGFSGAGVCPVPGGERAFRKSPLSSIFDAAGGCMGGRISFPEQVSVGSGERREKSRSGCPVGKSGTAGLSFCTAVPSGGAAQFFPGLIVSADAFFPAGTVVSQEVEQAWKFPRGFFPSR